MLPILRIIPVGGVFLAIMIVVLALDPPGGPRSALTSSRGTLIVATEHPEWRQLLMRAAIRRADELSRLRELPDMPTRTDRAQDPKFAGLPNRTDSDPDDDPTGTINETPGVTIPVDIGETSAFELPVTAREEKPPVITLPQRKTPSESRRKTSRRIAHARTPAKPPAARVNFFEAIFGGQYNQYNQPPAASGPAPVTVTSGADADQRLSSIVFETAAIKTRGR